MLCRVRLFSLLCHFVRLCAVGGLCRSARCRGLSFEGIPALGLEGDLFAVSADEVDAVFGFGDMTNEIDILKRNEFLVIV